MNIKFNREGVNKYLFAIMILKDFSSDCRINHTAYFAFVSSRSSQYIVCFFTGIPNKLFKYEGRTYVR